MPSWTTTATRGDYGTRDEIERDRMALDEARRILDALEQDESEDES